MNQVTVRRQAFNIYNLENGTVFSYKESNYTVALLGDRLEPDEMEDEEANVILTAIEMCDKHR